ncbi:MAG: hypothetical protein ACXVPL_11880, partial [Actinomycetota bacterium]
QRREGIIAPTSPAHRVRIMESESFGRELQLQRIEGRWERQGRGGGGRSRGHEAVSSGRSTVG